MPSGASEQQSSTLPARLDVPSRLQMTLSITYMEGPTQDAAPSPQSKLALCGVDHQVVLHTTLVRSALASITEARYFKL